MIKRVKERHLILLILHVLFSSFVLFKAYLGFRILILSSFEIALMIGEFIK